MHDGAEHARLDLVVLPGDDEAARPVGEPGEPGRDGEHGEEE